MRFFLLFFFGGSLANKLGATKSFGNVWSNGCEYDSRNDAWPCFFSSRICELKSDWNASKFKEFRLSKSLLYPLNIVFYKWEHGRVSVCILLIVNSTSTCDLLVITCYCELVQIIWFEHNVSGIERHVIWWQQYFHYTLLPFSTDSLFDLDFFRVFGSRIVIVVVIIVQTNYTCDYSSSTIFLLRINAPWILSTLKL